jgi:Domain of unknown function (DUF4276)
MRGVIIIVEGQSEEEFVRNVLANYLIQFKIYDVRAIKIQTSPGHKGGLTDYSRFKRDVVIYLKQSNDILVTSLIDFFKIPNTFPRYDQAQSIQNIVSKVEFLEQALTNDIGNPRFIPYIQLHEFEGLLFSDLKGFELIPNIPNTNRKRLEEVLNQYPNPELINDGEETAPSKRLLKLIPGYQKTFHGPLIALENGIDSIRQKCPRFRNWTTTLIDQFRNL